MFSFGVLVLATLSVLGIEAYSLLDLIRLHVNVKGEKPGLISYPSGEGRYIIGFYLPSFVKTPKLAFIHTVIGSKPPNVYTYRVDEAEVLEEGYEDIVSSIYIPVSYLFGEPHNCVFDLGDASNLSYVKVSDLRSLLVIANSIYFELGEIPYIWFDVSNGVYVLNVFISDHDLAGNIFFYVTGEEYKGPYLYLKSDFGDVGVDDVPKRVERKYVQVIRVNRIPYLAGRDLD